MMIISDAMFAVAAMQIRATAATLDNQISQLRDTRQWTGPDADRYFTEWETGVRQRLLNSAVKLEALALTPLI